MWTVLTVIPYNDGISLISSHYFHLNNSTIKYSKTQTSSITIIEHNLTRYSAESDFVSTSAKLYLLCNLWIIITPPETHYLTRWKQIELCFFLSFDSAKAVLFYVASLSKNTPAWPNIGILNIQRLYNELWSN